MAYRNGDPALYVAGQGGQIWALRKGRIDPRPVLDLSKLVSHGDEQGLLGLAFSPSGAYLYVNYTDRNGIRTSSSTHGATAAPISRRGGWSCS
jgi:hypothetical protein